MPYVIRWPHKRVIAVAAASLSLLVAASPAAAYSGSWGSPYQQYQPASPTSKDCPVPAASSVFSALGDNASYALLPGGDFSGSLDGWALNGASLVPGGEPWNVSGVASPQSLNLPSGSYAVTPSFCLTSQLPSWRFFAQASNGSWSTQLKVTALWSDIYGNSGQMTATTLSGGGFTSWQPTSVLPLGSMLSPGNVVNVRFVFSANGGAWNVDDVYIDPYFR